MDAIGDNIPGRFVGTLPCEKLKDVLRDEDNVFFADEHVWSKHY